MRTSGIVSCLVIYPHPATVTKEVRRIPSGDYFWPGMLGMFNIHELFTLSFWLPGRYESELDTWEVSYRIINGIMLWSASAAAASRFISPCHAWPFWKCWLILPRNKCECRTQTCPLKILSLFLHIGNNTKKRKKVTNKKTVCFEIWMNKLL